MRLGNRNCYPLTPEDSSHIYLSQHKHSDKDKPDSYFLNAAGNPGVGKYDPENTGEEKYNPENSGVGNIKDNNVTTNIETAELTNNNDDANDDDDNKS